MSKDFPLKKRGKVYDGCMRMSGAVWSGGVEPDEEIITCANQMYRMLKYLDLLIQRVVQGGVE